MTRDETVSQDFMSLVAGITDLVLLMRG